MQKNMEKFALSKKSTLSKSNVSHLTARQSDVAQFLLLGCTAKEIGKELGISFNTVQYHIKQIKWRLDAVSRSHMLRLLRSYETSKDIAFVRRK